MSSQHRTGTRRARVTKISSLMLVGALFLSGCSAEVQRGWLPAERDNTNHTGRIIDLWVNSWIAALIVGVITWGLIIWCIVAYRRRRNETGFPRQVSYNLPLEVFYLTIPLFMVLVFFYFTDRDQQAIDARVDNPDLVVDVRGKQWSWDFNYVNEDKYFSGVQANLTGEEGVPETLPTLYLPVNQTVELQLNARDVLHSFWVPAFLQKRDMIPGRTNYITLTPTREGTFDGKCAELCGEYHSEMLFNVAVVSQEEFDAHMATLEDGQLGEEYDRNSYSDNELEPAGSNG
ncbi:MULTISPECIES: cytochrome c oxidase subunit II [unclassified Arthrobacter]|uniref:aa3-type cytochrome oxidase subunit II n=1 Tax=unclassified Arthrobacter TaxID=235627 RepID=UPI0014908CD2|nr:cytochrome c oxidase subunit II [Arthrobacter sp. AET 35A]MBE0010620.1 cytochrome c oxidase subunit II [Arthrobacter sp. AET 35A]NOJ64481.1 cytochrome c oxidase subunit II [Arthrobacter sp. 147(2020)]